MVWYGYRELGLRARELPVNAMVAVWGWSKYLEKDGVKTKISTWMRNHPNSFPSEAKIVGGYINSVLATEEARIAGYDEAILLDNRERERGMLSVRVLSLQILKENML